MPKLRAVENIEEIYLCTSVPLPDSNETFYAIRFDPHSRKENVHHLVIYACAQPKEPNTGTLGSECALPKDPNTCGMGSEYAQPKESNTGSVGSE